MSGIISGCSVVKFPDLRISLKFAIFVPFYMISGKISVMLRFGIVLFMKLVEISDSRLEVGVIKLDVEFDILIILTMTEKN
jgi:hypothetical protein